MRILAITISFLLLSFASFQDIKEKQFYLAVPIVMFIINAGIRFYLTGAVLHVPEICLSAIVIIFSLATKQKLGLGDALVFAALMPLCGISGCIRVFTDAMLILIAWIFISKASQKKENMVEIAMVPFVSAGFILWAFI